MSCHVWSGCGRVEGRHRGESHGNDDGLSGAAVEREGAGKG